MNIYLEIPVSPSLSHLLSPIFPPPSLFLLPYSLFYVQMCIILQIHGIFTVCQIYLIKCTLLRLNLEREQNEHFLMWVSGVPKTKDSSVLKHGKYHVPSDSQMLEKGKWILKIQTLLRPTINRVDLRAETRKHQPFKFFLSEDKNKRWQCSSSLVPKV